MDTSYAYAAACDEDDALASFRKAFYVKEDTVYLDGNSLGLLSRRAEQTAQALLDAWGRYAIDGWSEGDHPWFYLSEQLGDQMAPLLGAMPEEVIATGSTTTNLHQLAATFYQPAGQRTKILADALTFPTDIYALKSQVQLKGYGNEHLHQVKSRDGKILCEEDIIAAMTEDIALIVLPSVLYRSGQILDMKRLTAEAHKRDILIGFDLCHSIGAMPHALSEWDVDFAFWCNYKYLNAGPGSVAGLYVNRRHFGQTPGLAGWFGSRKDKQFDMEHELSPAEDAGAYQIGTPHVLSTAPLLGSLEIFAEAGIERIRDKSLRLTRYMMDLVSSELSGRGITIGNPIEDKRRGGHVYLEHPEAARICKALKQQGVTPDFRAPSGIRLAPIALYNTYTDVWQAVHTLQTIMDEEQYKAFENTRDVIA